MSVPTIIYICNVLNIDSNSIFNDLLNYQPSDKDKFILESLSILNDKDKKVIADLIQYIKENREC